MTQVSPVCQRVARFSVRGHRGRNRIRFASRVGGKLLAAGTYRIDARTRNGRFVRQATLVVFERGVPTKAQLAAARARNVCAAITRLAFAGAATSASTASALAQGEQGAFSGGGQPFAGGSSKSSSPQGSAILGSGGVERAARAVRPALIALLAVAILLLGLASLPQVVVEPRFNELLVRHRLEIAGVGTAALVGVALAFLLG